MSRYNISKASKTLNISSELLRHYERLGLIEPKRAENGYRFFNAQDLDKLQGIRRYRNMGFSLAEMERLMYTADYNETYELHLRSLEETRRELAWQQALCASTEQILCELEQISENVGRIEETMSPQILRVNMRHNGDLDEGVDTGRIAQWLEYMPVAFISPAFHREEILAGTKDIWFGYGIRVEAFEQLGLEHIGGEVCIPGMRCLTTVIFSAGDSFISCEKLAPVVAYCEEKDLEICGDAWGVTLGNFSLEGVTHRYHRVFVPIRER